MKYHALVHLTEQVAAQATRRYWAFVFGPAIPGLTGACLCLLAWNLAYGNQSWIVWANAVFALFGVTMIIAIYFGHYRRVMRVFKRAKSLAITVTADDSNLTFTAGTADKMVPWTSITDIKKYDSFWILLRSSKSFEIVPVTGVPIVMQAFIEERINAVGNHAPSNKSLERTREE